MSRRSAALVLSVAVALALSACSSGPDVESIGPAEVADVVATSDVVLLDVRTPQEYASGHVRGAVNIDVSDPDFTRQIETLPTDETYVVYCRSGNRSAQAATIMAEAGFVDVRDVDAGLDTLAQAGVALVTP
jgi:rhodanese-related sulfurtransferase